MGLGYLNHKRSIAYKSRLPAHSTVIKINKKNNKSVGLISGSVNKDKFAILERKLMAMVTFSALKNTQAITVNLNVISICNNSPIFGSMLFCATTLVCTLFLFHNSNGKKYTAFNAPQTIKVQLAPCQKPLTIKIINT